MPYRFKDVYAKSFNRPATRKKIANEIVLTDQTIRKYLIDNRPGNKLMDYGVLKALAANFSLKIDDFVEYVKPVKVQ